LSVNDLVLLLSFFNCIVLLQGSLNTMTYLMPFVFWLVG